MTAFAIYVHLAAQVPYVPRPIERNGAGRPKGKVSRTPEEMRAYGRAYMRARRAGKRDIVV